MRNTVRDNLADEQGNAGCLMGELDEYVKAYDDQKAQLEEQFDKNDKLWNKKLEDCDFTRQI